MGRENISIFKSMLWNTSEKIGSTAIQFIVSIFLARILSPTDYGTLAIIVVLVNVMTIIIETGFGSALIQKKDLTYSNICQIFTINVSMSIILYVLSFLIVPYFASIYPQYDVQLLIKAIRVYSLILPIGGITSCYNALIYREMEFNKSFWANTIAVLVSGACGIASALYGLGVWALVIQQLSNKVTLLIALLCIVKVKPRFAKIQRESFGMIKLGGTILATRLVRVIGDELTALIIGKFSNPDDLAYYNRGSTLPSMITTSTDYALQKVMFSAYSKSQDDVERIKDMLRKTLSISSYIMLPLMFGLFLVAPETVEVLLTAKWVPSIPYIRVFCISLIFVSCQTAFVQVLNAVGDTFKVFCVTLVAQLIKIVLVFVLYRFGLIYIAIGGMIVNFSASVLYMIIVANKLKCSVWFQAKDVIPNIILTLVSILATYGVSRVLNINSKLISLILQIAVAVILYVLLSVITRNKTFLYFVEKIKKGEIK